MSTSTLTTSFITNFIKTMLDLRFINMIKNCERKQETRIRKCVTLVLLAKILERVMLLEKFVDVFRQCKQSLSNKGLQL